MLNVNDIQAYVHICIHMHTWRDIYVYCTVFLYVYYTYMNIYYQFLYFYEIYLENSLIVLDQSH